MKTPFLFLICFICTISFNSCMSVLGLRQEKDINDRKILKLANRFGLKGQSIYKIDSVKYDALLKSKNLDSKELNNLQQPNQILVFNRMGENTANLINCNIGGFPLLKWNRCRGFDSIPLRQGYFIKPKLNLTPGEIESAIVNLRQWPSHANVQQSGYQYYIFWSRLLFRNSKKMLKLVKKNIAKVRKTDSVTVKFIYSDSMYF